MALNLVIETGQANQNIQQIMRSLDTLKASLDSFAGGSSGIERLAKTFSSITISPTVVQTTQALAAALERLGQVADMSKVVTQLQSLSRLDMRAFAQNVQAVSQALSQLRVPPGLDALAQMLQRVSTASNQAGQSLNSLRGHLQSINVPPGLAGITQRFGQASQAGGVFGMVLRGLPGLLAGFGVALGGAGLANFIQDAMQMVNAMDRFNATMGAVVPTAKGVGDAWEFVRQVSQKLGVDIQANTNAFGKMAIVARDSGLTFNDTKTIFVGFSTAFRAFGADTAATARGMEAVTQVISKGKVSLEEIRRQLGQTIPAFSTMARAMGMSTAELEKMISAGKIGVSALVKTAEQFANDYTAVAAKMAQAWGGVMTQMSNAWKIASLSFGRGFETLMIPAIQRFTEALNRVSFQQFMQALGLIAGVIGNTFVGALTIAVEAINAVVFALRSLIEGGTVIAQMLVSVAGAIAEGFRTTVEWVNALAESLYNALPQAVQSAVSWLGGVLAEGMRTTAEWVIYLWDQLKGFASWLGGGVIELVAAAMRALGFATTEAGIAMDEAAQKAKVWNDHLGDTANAAASAATSTGRAASAADKLGSSARSAADGLNSTKSSVNSLDGSMNHAIGTANALAAALAKLANTPMPSGTTSYGDELGGGMPGTTSYGDDLYAGSYAGGGIVGSPPGYARAPASAFIGARHFADGGLSDGGIPSVLHEGEAVVPLASGAIPVSGAGFPPAAMSLAQETLLSVRTINQSVKDVDQTIINVGVMLHDDLEKQYGCLLRLESLGASSIDALNAVAVATARSGGGGGGFIGGGGGFSGGGGGGGSATSPYGPAATVYDKNGMPYVQDVTGWYYPAGTQLHASGQRFNEYGQTVEEAAAGNYFFRTGGDMTNRAARSDPILAALNKGRKIPQNLISPKLAFGGLMSKAEAAALNSSGSHIWDSWDAGYGIGSSTANTNPDSPDFGKFQDYTGANTGGMFALGTPNTSNIPGMTSMGAGITVHPDEAIIPLPDGRSVPVKMMGPGGAGGRPTNVNVQMTIHTKDAASFKMSEDQIMRELSMKMQRALDNIGGGSDSDDPTKRPVKNT